MKKQNAILPLLRNPQDADFVAVSDYIPSVSTELKYASSENFTSQVIYGFQDAFLRYGTVKKLQAVSDALAGQGFRLKIWDAFRPVSAQFMLWQAFPDDNYVANPKTGHSNHSRGNAVDLTLTDLQGNELPMPSDFDDFSPLADRDYSDCPESAAHNALLLQQVMERHGFAGYDKEWWHYADRDSYPVEEHFDPAVISRWCANRKEAIDLRSCPSTSANVITQLPAQEDFLLLGWDQTFALVDDHGLRGYVLSSEIRPKDRSFFQTFPDVVRPTGCYCYGQMLADIAVLSGKFPRLMTCDRIGTSELGRDIPVVRLGSPAARYHVLLQGAMHGREHMTAWLLMAMLDGWANRIDRGFQGFEDVCFHIIPMSNPDGVVISQSGMLNPDQLAIYQRDTALGYSGADPSEYARRWKANGLGIDLNRNFSAGWESAGARAQPSSQQYRGTAPFSASETRALRDYTLKYPFAATVSYHATGSEIYHQYGKHPVNSRCESLGKAIGVITGYGLVESSGVIGAGYKDWAIDVLGIPSLTIEIGCQDAPLAERECESIFARNADVLFGIAQWLKS